MSTPGEQILVIGPDGDVSFVWDDALAGLVGEGTPTITRVSDVEPTPDGQWQADLSRIGGPVLGPYPFREFALVHERAVVTGRLIAGQLITGRVSVVQAG